MTKFTTLILLEFGQLNITIINSTVMNQLDYEANAVNLQILFIAFNSNRTKLFKN